jgi:integrase
MPRVNSHIPAYRLHKSSGQARVIIKGEHVYLGRYGSPESREKYSRIIADLTSPDTEKNKGSSLQNCLNPLSINELILAYWRFAKTYYQKDGNPTKELWCMRDALRPLRHLYAHTEAAKFGPKALKKVRQSMIDHGLSRGVINSRINRIKRTFKWAVAEELIPPHVLHGLQAVGGLRFGRTEARETEPVKPAQNEDVHAILPFLAPPVAAIIELQWLTGMRSGEIVIMRPCDIDMTDEIWTYEASDHKNRWRGHRKLVPLGPKAQAIIAPFLNRNKDLYLFSPREAWEWQLKHRQVSFKAERKTPIYPSELKAREKAKQTRRRRTPKRPKRNHYDTDSYRRAIMYGFKKAQKAGVQIPHWHPHQLRHSLATEIRKKYGIEAAQIALGHARADVTEVYAEKNMEIAKKIAREMG